MKRFFDVDLANVVIFGVAWALSLPWILGIPIKGLDSSWTVGLYWAFGRGLQFGKDVVFTYGPLGFLDVPYYADYGLWRIAVVFALFMHTVLFVSAYIAVRQTALGSGSWARVLASLPMAIVLGLRSEFGAWTAGEEIVISAILLLYVYYLRTYQSGRSSNIALCASASILLAVASLIKYNYAADAILLLTAFGIVLGFRWKRQFGMWLVAASLYLVSVLLLWAASGQSIFNFELFVLGGIQVTIGYASAMALSDVWWERAFGVASIVTVLLTLLYYLKYRSITLPSLIALSLGPMFVTFKSVYVRQSATHTAAFYLFVEPLLAIISIVTVVEIARDFKRIRRIVPALAPLLLVIMLIFLPTMSLNEPAILNVNTSYAASKISNYDYGFSLFGNEQLGEAYLSSIKANVRNDYQLSPVLAQDIGNSSVDIFPWDIALVWAYDMNWSPRPVFQSYNAYTTWLDQINAAHFSSASAPEYVLFGYGSVDSRYALFDEPETFRTILCRYQYVTSDANFALLRLTQTQQCGNAIEIGETFANMGQSILIPQTNDSLYARVSINYSFLGSVANILYKPADVYVSFQLSNGSLTNPYRFIPGNAEDGVYVSEYVDSFNSLTRLFQGQTNLGVKALMFTSQDPAQYQPSIKIQYFQVRTDFSDPKHSHSLPPDSGDNNEGLNSSSRNPTLHSQIAIPLIRPKFVSKSKASSANLAANGALPV